MTPSTLRIAAFALTVALSPFVTRADAPQPPARKPNILFLLSDDQRPDALAFLGNPTIRTPNLDRLAARGVAFTQAHIMGGMNAAICAPSRAAILTSRTIFHCPEQPKGDHAIWPATFAAVAGYDTFQTGKWHNGPGSLNLAFADNRNTFLGGMTTDHFKTPLFAERDPAGKYPRAAAKPAARFDAEVFADTTIDFLRARRADSKPFFAWCSFTTPHDPRQAPPDYMAMYDPATIPLPKNFMARPPLPTGVLDIRDEKLLPLPRTEAAVRKELAAYYASITHLDAQVGRILDALEQSGQADNTIVIFAGDNGLALGSHGLLGKQNVYAHSSGVPLIMAGPGIPKNRRSPALVYLLDLFPTTCDLFGIPIPVTVEGQSFAPVFQGQPAPRTTLFAAYMKLHRMVRDDRWKLIEWRVAGQRTLQLFDLRADPDELHDLAKDPARAAEMARLEAQLKADQRALDDPAL